jgi:extracellular elastinolytic metalloproteinase
MTIRFTLLCLTIMLGTSSLVGQVKDPLQLAQLHIQKHLKELKLEESDIKDAIVSDIVVSKHNKLTHLYLQQAYEGIAVHNAIMNINIMEDGEILSLGNRFESQLSARINTTTPGISMEEALMAFMRQFQIADDAAIRMVEQISAHEAIFDHIGLALEPIRVKLAYQPTNDRSIRLAWNVDFYQLDGQHWWNARVDAQNGHVLNYFDQVVQCEFDVTHDNCTTHGTHAAPALRANTTTTNSLNMVDGSIYNVFPLPVESPNHGDRALVENPADPTASPYGWHDTNAEEGPEYTITRGNNVHAYHDIFDLNQSVGGEPDGGEALNFDFELDLSLGRPYTQLDPATTNLFYWNNVMHDMWYHYGFDEASGNFQVNNYGNGGAGGDHVRAEALDGSGTNNANMATPPDGQNPRMQMYLWGGQLPNVSSGNAMLNVTSPEGVAGSYDFAQAGFGGDLPANGEVLTGQVVLADDGVGEGADACEALVNGAEISGNIAMIDRGSCEFGFKCLAAEEEGAIAVIVCNNVNDGVIQMGAGAVGNQVTIPAIMVSLQDCNTIKMGLPELTVEITAPEFVVPNPGPTGRDSDFDNGVIIHEYTHGISIRLTGGPSQSGCLTNFEQAGEGWSDWFALVMTATAEQTADQGRGIGTYASGQGPNGGGIRTYPYSRDLNTNLHTYADINSESVPHGVGSVFCVTIWDLYWNLIDEYGFDEDFYFGNGGNNIAMQLVLDGLKLQPCNPNFLEARDAILAADMANYDGANQCIIWETFARRGIGFSAEEGGGEAFDIAPACSLVFTTSKTGVEEADAGSIIDYTLNVTNGRLEGINNGIVEDQLPEGTTLVEGSASCDVTVDGQQLTFNVGSLESGESTTCTYQVQLPEFPASYVSFQDGVEGGPQNWTFQNPTGPASWEVTFGNTNSGTFGFRARNIEESSDQILLLSDPITLEGENPALGFWHYYDTEAAWDGGVVEISTDGSTWVDLGDKIIQNPYDGPVNDNPASPISGRPAFHGKSDGWIQTVIDLTDYAGTAFQVRFRFATDGAVGGDGWYIDDFRFFGNFHAITNVACTEANEEGDILCSEVTTIVFGNPVDNSTTEVGQAEQLRVFPNPNNGTFTVQLSSSVPKAAQLRVMSIDGRLLSNWETDAFLNREIDLSTYGAGVYLVQLITDKGITNRKVVVK